MELQKLLAGVEVLQWGAEKNTEICSVRNSSREVQPGDLFVAIPGFATDGHK